MTLWSFAARTWRRPGVEQACLALQDRHGQCVALLLWRLWTLAEGRAANAATVRAAVGLARTWNDSALGPLRSARRSLATPTVPIADAAREALGEQGLAAELDAERRLLEGLETLTPPTRAARAEPLAALADLTEAWGDAAPVGALRRLLTAAA